MNRRHRALWVVLLIACVLGGVSLVWGMHGHWLDHYRDALGRGCCGPADCIQVHARMLAQTRHEVTVEVEWILLVLPVRSVHSSEDEHDWFCANSAQARGQITQSNARCVFIAAGG